MKITRVWDMPNSETFSIPKIEWWVKSYLMHSKVSVDPFARNKRWATYTNDLNPNTAAQYHMDATDFCMKLAADGAKADLVLFDPPYSLGQCKEVYQDIGRPFLMEDAQQVGRWVKMKAAICDILTPNGAVLTFGWNSIGMGKERGFEIEQIMLVAHGYAHNDTICLAERRLEQPPQLF